VDRQPSYAPLAEDGWLDAAGRLLDTYFTLEDPNRLEPESRELHIDHQLPEGPLLRGIIDRLDVAPDGALRVVDYKTGKSPRLDYESSAVFQTRFYGLLVWRQRGRIPAMLQLVYLGDGQVLRSVPSEADLELTETKIRAVWDSIIGAARAGDFPPRKSALCGWCAHQALCPAFGGTAPTLDATAVAERFGT
jgi:putative RecB family exonuclease